MLIEDEGRFTFCVAAIIENQNNEILLLKRSPGNFPENIWDVVGGRKEQFEDPFDGLKREIVEETGIEDFEIIKAVDVFHWYQEDNNFDMIGVIFWCKTKANEVILSSEHAEYKWLKPEKALEISTHQIVTSNLEMFIKEKQRLGLELE
ncbi:MAG: NUDIX domain-containing protein [Asgard group archaeon]|nr:NUDIX domain-containing protein [Asgard group archaeon]